MYNTLKIFLLCLFFTISAAAQSKETPDEYSVLALPIKGTLAEKSSEISGLAWYGDKLIILPQYPDKQNNNVFSLSRQTIDTWIDNLNQIPLVSDRVSVNINEMRIKGMQKPETELRPQPVSVDFNGLFNKINGYEGFESIGFIGRWAFLTIECKDNGATFAYLVRGRMNAEGTRLIMDSSIVCKIPPQADLRNFSDEALVCYNDEIYTFYEANGRNVNHHPVAHRFNIRLEMLGLVPFTNLEYRLTDATCADEEGRFWIMNYLWPRERDKLQVDTDSLTVRYGQGKTHKKNPAVERLVEFQIKKDAIERTDRNPLQLKLLSNDSRNWEGIVRLPGKGFLLATDRFPRTILAFIPVDIE